MYRIDKPMNLIDKSTIFCPQLEDFDNKTPIFEEGCDIAWKQNLGHSLLG